MRWNSCTLTNPKEVGKDSLNNPIQEDEEVYKTYCRTTPFNQQDLSLEGRSVTVNSRKFLIQERKEKLPKFNKVIVENSVYTVKKVLSLNKFTLVYAEVFKE